MAFRLPGEMTRDELASPGVALARQARADSAVGALFLRVLVRFLEAARRAAVADGFALGAGQLYASWDEALAVEVGRSDLPAIVLDYAVAVLIETDVPGVAYETIRAVLTAASIEQWPERVTADQLRIALAPDAAETALTAAAYPRHGAAWEGLDQGGMKFMDRMKRDARTAVTGLDGMLTVTALGDKGFTRKRWVTKHDKKVRETHRHAEGQTVALEEPFYVGGFPLMYPGERGGPAGEVINCRCVIVGTRWRATDRSGRAPMR